MECSSASYFDDKLSTLICRNCKLYLNVSPIMLFDDGSSVCGRCYKEEDYTDDDRPVRNNLYESLSPYVPFPCKYRDAGCKERRAGKLLTTHESLCSYRSSNCPVSECSWMGQIKTLQQHYKAQHEDLYVTNNKLYLNINQDYEESKFILDREMQYVVQVKCEIDSGNLWFSAVNVSAPISSALYYLELSFKYLEKPDSSIVFKTVVSENIQSIDKNEALPINLEMLQKLLNKTQNIEVCVSFSVAENKNLMLDSSLLKEFECPVCNHYMVSPIFMCSNGHSICHYCKTQLDNCPICRIKLNNVHNFALESIIGQINYPCKYIMNGCRYVLPACEIQSHENVCILRPITANVG